MQLLMVVCPINAVRGAGRAGCQVPVKIIAADGSEKDKCQQMEGWGDAEQQAAGLPDHYYGAYGNIEAAEYYEIDNFSPHDIFRL